MAEVETDVLACSACGASIYPEHLDRGLAGRRSGKLLCMHCMQEASGGVSPAADAAASAEPAPRAAPRGPTTFRRNLQPDAATATRCKTFHCKLTDASISHMDALINEWVDQHDDVVVKFATSTVGVVEGKHNDPHLIVTLFY